MLYKLLKWGSLLALLAFCVFLVVFPAFISWGITSLFLILVVAFSILIFWTLSRISPLAFSMMGMVLLMINAFIMLFAFEAANEMGYDSPTSLYAGFGDPNVFLLSSIINSVIVGYALCIWKYATKYYEEDQHEFNTLLKWTRFHIRDK